MFWTQLTTPDPDAAAQFYTALFDWTVDMPPRGPGLPRGAFFPPSASDGPARSVAGLEPMSAWQQQQDASARWTPFLHTPDVVAMTERAQFHGATLVEPAMPAHGEGWRALLADPTGATYGVWEPAEDRPPAPSPDPSSPSPSPGALVWSELQTPDPYAARDYYCELMAWSTDDPNENPDFIAEDFCFLWNGVPLARLREVRRTNVPEAPRWLPGFSVDSIEEAEEKAHDLGATVSEVPAPIEGETPPVALLTDPAGAACLLVEPQPDSSLSSR